jgi:hypothetical protein
MHAPPAQDTQIYLDTIRECYEAFVIYNFFMYLLAYLEEEYGDISVYLSTKEEVGHMWGVQYLCRPWRSGEEFLWQCKKARSPPARALFSPCQPMCLCRARAWLLACTLKQFCSK